MTTRKPTSSGPQYGMVAFAGSRQPPGPSPRAIELLHEAKIQVAAEPAPAEAPGPAPTEAPRPAPVPAPVSVPEPAPAPAAAAASGMTEPQSAEVTRRAPARPRRPKPAPVDSYALPTPDVKKPKARSNHFRLPADVEAHLIELAAMHGCSRTRVVCSAITSEWQRLHRRRSRAGKVDE